MKTINITRYRSFNEKKFLHLLRSNRSATIELQVPGQGSHSDGRSSAEAYLKAAYVGELLNNVASPVMYNCPAPPDGFVFIFSATNHDQLAPVLLMIREAYTNTQKSIDFLKAAKDHFQTPQNRQTAACNDIVKQVQTIDPALLKSPGKPGNNTPNGATVNKKSRRNASDKFPCIDLMNCPASKSAMYRLLKGLPQGYMEVLLPVSLNKKQALSKSRFRLAAFAGQLLAPYTDDFLYNNPKAQKDPRFSFILASCKRKKLAEMLVNIRNGFLIQPYKAQFKKDADAFLEQITEPQELACEMYWQFIS